MNRRRRQYRNRNGLRPYREVARLYNLANADKLSPVTARQIVCSVLSRLRAAEQAANRETAHG